MHPLIIIFLNLYFLHPSLGQSLCHVPGECLNSIGGGGAVAATYNECLKKCQDNRFDCKFFTHYSNDQRCLFFSNCVSVSEVSCNDCFTGEDTCSPLQSCDIIGYVIGTQLEAHFFNDKDACLSRCKTLDDCHYYTFDTSDNLCFLFKDFQGLDGTCTTCISGEKTCPLDDSFPNWSKVMLVGGYPVSSDAVEILDISEEMLSCEQPSEYPIMAKQTSGTFINRQAMICGNTFATKECYVYDSTNDLWQPGPLTSSGRMAPNGVMINDSTWWLVGGGGSAQSDPLVSSTSEIFSATAGWRDYSRIPNTNGDNQRACLFKVNATHIFAFGLDGASSTHFFDLTTETWLGPYATGPNTGSFPLCGMVTRPETASKEVIIAMGSSGSTAHAFSIQDLLWRDLPPTPFAPGTHLIASVQYQKSFVALGGTTIMNNFAEIYRFNETDSTWTELKVKLKVPQGYYAAFAVPDDYVHCS